MLLENDNSLQYYIPKKNLTWKFITTIYVCI